MSELNVRHLSASSTSHILIMNHFTHLLVGLAIPVSLWAGMLFVASLFPSHGKSQRGRDAATSSAVDRRLANRWRSPPRAPRLHRHPAQSGGVPPGYTRAGGLAQTEYKNRTLPYRS